MSDFLQAYERMIVNEGGYKLTNVANDRGGLTYAGIARNKNPQWPGWVIIDAGEVPPTEMVRDFYRDGFWNPLNCDHIHDQDVARTIFDFAINTSTYGRPTVAAKLAQIVVGATPDGYIGPKTLAALNGYLPALFLAQYAIAKMARYEKIVSKDRSQGKFLLGWLRRTLKEAA